MKRTIPFLSLLVVLSIISGWLMSRMSWLGRVGVNLVHKEYKFLKVWYKGAGVVLAIWLALFGVHSLVQKKMPPATARVAHIIALLAAIAGLYFTYSDFRHDFSHRVLKERFHLGAYLFWIGWMLVCLFFLTQKRDLTAETEEKVGNGQ